MTIRKALAAAISLAAAAGAVLLNAAPAEAASSLRVYRIYYDSPGSDTRTNASLNAEYIAIKNYSTSTRYLTNWTVRDSYGYTYTFPSTAVGAGKLVVLHTGKGSSTTGHRYWQRTNYVWNNNYDKATLRNGSGTIVHTCSYNDGSNTSTLYKNC